MGYFVRVERYSISPRGHKLASFVITYPRVCLAEVYTHRLVYDTGHAPGMWNGEEGVYLTERTAERDQSKNSASSRAISLEKFVSKIQDDPYVPTWSMQQKGMQGEQLTDEQKISHANQWCLRMRDQMITGARALHELGVHKQDCNRYLEPWQWVTQIVTSSRWDNYFALRCHHMAFPPFRKIARMMYLALRKETPTQLDYGQWHLPFVPLEEQMTVKYWPGVVQHDPDEFPIEIKRSAARCAWISYENADKIATDEAILSTYKRLFSEIPVHASPVEHQASPMHMTTESVRPELKSNLAGWVQARKLIKHEAVLDCQFTDEEIAKWDDVPADMK